VGVPLAVRTRPRRTRPDAILPDDPTFSPSANGRNGWKYEHLYDIGDEVRVTGQLQLHPNAEYDLWGDEISHVNLTSFCCVSRLPYQQLGKGAFGAVFVGTHKFANYPDEYGDSFAREWKEVAIKKTKPNSLDLRGAQEIREYDDMERKCQEIKALMKLQGGSPKLSPVMCLYEYFISPGNEVFLITERLGQELHDWRSECEEFTERMAIDICRTVLKSLSFISSRGVVHRDIKLQNILFRRDGDFQTLKLVDFGLARVLEADETTRDFCGSLGYIAPEIYQGERYRFEVDMFSFGVLLFRLLSGERPFPSNEPHILKRDTVMLQYNVQGNDWEIVSAAAKDLVRKLLINRQERLTAEQALKHSWFSEVGASVLRADLSHVGNDPSRSRAFVQVRSPLGGLWLPVDIFIGWLRAHTRIPRSTSCWVRPVLRRLQSREGMEADFGSIPRSRSHWLRSCRPRYILFLWSTKLRLKMKARRV
jgi:serine/threonine protein kinase